MGRSNYYANQLWIGARFIESLTLVLGFVYLSHGRKPNVIKVFVAYSVVTLMLILSIFTWKVFPECFIEGFGLTPFKKISEYIICTILLAAVFLLQKNRLKFDIQIYRLLFVSILCTMISELAFTFYVSNYGFSNLVGHYFKLFSFYLIYLAIIRTGMEEPYALIFREIESANQKLKAEISMKIESERKREQLIVELKNALEEIKTLKGIIPICANCKKIRDDTGYWNQLEYYISTHSDAKFSHGICPDCMEKLYPNMDFETS